MANRNKNKGRAAELELIEFLGDRGHTTIDIAANDGVAAAFANDVLMWPKGVTPKWNWHEGKDGQCYQVQSKYSSNGRYFKGIYNRHEREGINVGNLRLGTGGDAWALMWSNYRDESGDVITGGYTALAAWLDSTGGASLKARPVGNYISKEVLSWLALEHPIVAMRMPHKPWIFAWRSNKYRR